MLATLKRRKAVEMLLVTLICIPMVAPLAAGAASPERELGKIKSKQLDEISGIAASHLNPNLLWVHNDGNSGLVHGISKTGKRVASFKSPVRIEDIEDIAIGPGPQQGAYYLYLGDIGDNDLRRGEVRVVRLLEPKLSPSGDGEVAVDSVEELRLVYPDGPHNAEALFVDPIGGDLFVVTKEKGGARLYGAAATSLKDRATTILRLEGALAATDISGGDISHDGRWIALRRENVGWLWTRADGESVATALRRPPRMAPVRGERQGPNGEAISFSPSGKSYYTVSEGKKQVICEFALPAATAAR